LTDTNGVGVWPNVSSWIRDESRSRSRSNLRTETVRHAANKFGRMTIDQWLVISPRDLGTIRGVVGDTGIFLPSDAFLSLDLMTLQRPSVVHLSPISVSHII